MKPQIKRFILISLQEMDGIPMTSRAMEDQVRITFPGVHTSDILDARRDLETNGYVCGNTNTAIGTVTWTLTEKGQHAAKQL